VLGPSWVSATNVTLYANGIAIRSRELQGTAAPTRVDLRVNWSLNRPSHDIHLVAIATGPGVTAPYWAIPRPYQPSSRKWVGRVIGSTNPVWVDADGDGAFVPARTIARRIINCTGVHPNRLVEGLRGLDQAVASQAASLCHAMGVEMNSAEWSEALSLASQDTRDGFDRYFETLP